MIELGRRGFIGAGAAFAAVGAMRAWGVPSSGRAIIGDSRRSWTWPWRAALWARLGDGAKAGEMLEALLKYNTLDNMFATHPPFQIDGNLGMVASVCEILLERSVPPKWPHRKVSGLRTRDGKTVSFEW